MHSVALWGSESNYKRKGLQSEIASRTGTEESICEI